MSPQKEFFIDIQAVNNINKMPSVISVKTLIENPATNYHKCPYKLCFIYKNITAFQPTVCITCG